MRELKIPRGGLWDDDEWLLVVDWEGTLEYSGKRCPHKIDIGEEIRTRHDGSTYSNGRIYRVPLVAVLQNEGGYNSTGLCLLCAIEQMDKGKS